MDHISESPTKQQPDLHLVNSRLTALRGVDASHVIKDDTEDVGDASTITSNQLPNRQSASGWTTPGMDSMYTSGTSTPAPGHERHPAPQMRRYSEDNVIQMKKTTSVIKTTQKGIKTTTKYFYEEIDSSWTAALIVACFFVSGLTDTVCYETWSVFVSMQTGNTLFLALRLSNQPSRAHPLAYLKNLISLIGYLLGAFFFNMLHRAPTGTSISEIKPPLHRWTLMSSFVIQSLLVTTTAILAQTGVISTSSFVGGNFSSGSFRNVDANDNYLDLLPIALLAFDAAGQVCLSRVLIVNELPTIVITTIYHDLISEGLAMKKVWQDSTSKWDFAVKQKKQIRRLLSVIALFSGALVGGFLFASPAGLAGTLWFAAGVKILICIAWCVWPRRVVTETVVTRTPSNPQPATRG